MWMRLRRKKNIYTRITTLQTNEKPEWHVYQPQEKCGDDLDVMDL